MCVLFRTPSQGLYKKVQETVKQPIDHKHVNYMNFLSIPALTSACLLTGGNASPAMLTALQNGNEVLAAEARVWDHACLKC